MTLDTNITLNDVLMLKQSETDITEAYMLGIYHLQQTCESSVMNMIINDISGVIESVTSSISKAGYNFGDKILSYLVNSTTFIEKSKKVIEPMREESIDFYINGYNFSVLNSPRIDFSELNKIFDEYSQFVTNINKLIQTSSLGDSLKIEQLSSGYRDENSLSKLRAQMLGCNCESISGENFLMEVKKFYRSGTTTKELIYIDKLYVMAAINDVKSIKTELERTKKDFDYLNKVYDSIINTINLTLNSISNTQQKQVCLDIPTNGVLDTDTSKAISFCLSAINSKYFQVVELRNIAEIILGGRLSALRDQIIQIMEILSICGNIANDTQTKDDVPVVKTPTGKELYVYAMPLTEDVDYMETALEQSILCETEYQSVITERYNQEMMLLESCLEHQMVMLLEDSGNISKRYQSVKTAFITFMDRLIAAIRKKTVAYNKRYIPWLHDIGEEEMIKKAQSMTSMSIAPYFDANDIVKDSRDIASEIQKASKATDKASLDFTKKFVDNFDTQEKYDMNKGDLPGYLKNYFRFHKKNADSVKKQEISGKDLANKVSMMLKYIENYEKNSKSLENLSTSIQQAVDDMDKVMESFDYLQLLERPACESDLILLEGYQALLEAEDEKKTGTVINEKGEEESPTSVETSDQKQEKDAKENGQTPNKSSKYSNTFQHFFQLVIGAYVTAMEERFINYVNVLSLLSGTKPTVDKDGKYAPKNEEKSNKETPQQESVLPQRLYDKPSVMKGATMYSRK